MQNITGLLARIRDAELPLRPLMYAAGAALTAAGVYYYYIRKKKCDDEEKERRAEQEDTPLSQGTHLSLYQDRISKMLLVCEMRV